MDIVLVILGAIALLAGIAGSILPLLPGPPLAWLALLLIHFSARAHMPVRTLVVTGAVTILVLVIDLVAPIWIGGRKGISKASRYGIALGLLLGLWFPPWGFLAGPLLGAFAGELLAGRGNARKAGRAAWGAFKGFLFGAGLKLLWCLALAGWFIHALAP